MTLEEKLAKRKAEKAKEERWINIGSLALCWPLAIVLGFHLILVIADVAGSNLDYRSRVIMMHKEVWWLLIPLIAAYYRIRICHRNLGL